jgi:DNA-3-methyladenine glycosylase II
VSTVSFALDPVAPFRLDFSAWTLRRRLENAVDRWDGEAYQRTLTLADSIVEVTVTQVGAPDQPRLHITGTGIRLAPGLEGPLTAALERLLGLRTDLTTFYHFAAADPQLGPLVARFRGMKPPRFPTVFEALVNGIACQQITLIQGIHLLNRLAERYGVTPGRQDGSAHAFPQPADLATLEPETLRSLGFSHQKGQAIVALARAITGGQLDLEGLADVDDAAAAARLRTLRGVGRWTAEYVLLRGLGRVHVFPGDDVGARNHLQHWLHLRESLTYTGVRQALAGWQDYGGLIYFHLLLDRLAEAGYLAA